MHAPPLTRDEFPEEVRRHVGEIRRLDFPPQGMTSAIAIVDGDTGRLVVKRSRGEQFSDWLAEEYRVLQTLAPLSLPAPRARGFYRRTTPHGPEAWLLMDLLPGEPVIQALEKAPGAAERRALLGAFGEVLAAIHRTPAPPELVRPGGSWIEDTLARAQYNLRHFQVDGSPEMLKRLLDNRPPPVAQTLIHGDFTLDNTLVEDGKVTGVIDWSGGALGDPRYDLALATQPEPGLFDGRRDRQAFYEGYGGPELSPDEAGYFVQLYEFF